MKSLAKNSIYNILYRCLNVVFPLVTVSYVSHVLQAKGIGEVSSASNIANYFTILAALGLPTYGTKVIAACITKKDCDKAFWELFSINLMSTGLFSVAYYLMIFSHPFFQDELPLYCVVGLAIIFNFINVDWFYQGKEEFGFIAIRSFIIKSLSLIAIFFLVRTKEDVLNYALILTLSNVANYIFNIIHIRKFVSLSKCKLNIPQHIKPIVTLLLASFIIELYTMFGITILTIFSTPESVGYYSNSVAIIRIIRSLVTAVCAVFLPRLSYYYSSGDKVAFENLIEKGLNILIYMTVPAAIGITMISSDAVTVFFGDSFYKASVSIDILSITIITIALSNYIGYQIFITIGKEKLMVVSTIVGAIINLALNILLVAKLDFIGVAIASSISELAVTIYQVIKLKQLSLFKIDVTSLRSVLLSSLFMTVVVLIISLFRMPAFIELVLSIIAGAATYIFLTYLQKSKVSLLLFSKLPHF